MTRDRTRTTRGPFGLTRAEDRVLRMAAAYQLSGGRTRRPGKTHRPQLWSLAEKGFLTRFHPPPVGSAGRAYLELVRPGALPADWWPGGTPKYFIV